VYATLKSIKHGVYNLDLEPFKQCNPQALDLLSKLLERDPKKRWTAKKAYSHPWIQNLNMTMKVNFRSLKKLVNMKGLKRTILMYMALQIPEKEVENLL
jgi:calcium-dependent protein kinase